MCFVAPEGGCHTSHASGRASHGLYADAVLRVLDGAAFDDHAIDDVAGAEADRADRDTVAVIAAVAEELDIGTRVDGETVVLICDDAVLDGDIRGLINVETVRVVAQIAPVAIGVVDDHVRDNETTRSVNRKSLNRRVLHSKSHDRGFSKQLVCSEELWLHVIVALAIPPQLTVGINEVS